MPDEPELVKPAKKSKRVNSQAGRQRGHMGWTIMRTPSRRHMHIYPSGYARKNLSQHPQHIYWPILDDIDGCHRVIELVMDHDLESLRELTLQYPEHVFGFEDMLKHYAGTGREVIERVTLRRHPLARDHRLDTELVKLLDGTIELRAVLRRGEKPIKSETYWSGTLAAFLAGGVSERRAPVPTLAPDAGDEPINPAAFDDDADGEPEPENDDD